MFAPMSTPSLIHNTLHAHAPKPSKIFLSIRERHRLAHTHVLDYVPFWTLALSFLVLKKKLQ